MLRRMQFLHHLCPPGKIHYITIKGEHSERSEGGGENAKLQRVSLRPRRAFGKHVLHGGKEQKGMHGL